MEAISRHLEGRRLALDVGAHIGDYSSAMAGIFQHVTAFEPSPRSFELLKANTACYQNVTIHPNALGNKTGTVMFTTAGKSLSHRVADDGDTEVIMTSIDDAGMWYGCDFIKIDVEGYELEVLWGAVSLIKRTHPLVMIEESFDPTYGASEFLKTLGYKQVERLKHDRIFKYDRR